MLVVDEADLVFSFGYEDEIKKLMTFLPKLYQAILASATLSEDVKNLKSLILHNPVTLKLEEPDLAPASQLTHYHLHAEEMDKAAILCSLLKLHLIRGKTIIFVNTVDKCYKIKLFLEQFAIRTCVLNSELPAAIRCHSVNQFNQGIYDIIVASDEKSLEDPGDKKEEPVKNPKEEKTKRVEYPEALISNVLQMSLILIFLWILKLTYIEQEEQLEEIIREVFYHL
nr:unnamed protein product [Callosobruchus chinensis]